MKGREETVKPKTESNEAKDGKSSQESMVAMESNAALSKPKRAIAFVKRHGLEIFLGATSIGLGVAYCFSERGRRDLLLVSASKSVRISELEDLCMQKDRCFMELMSDALRHGSSLAGLLMYERKEHLGK